MLSAGRENGREKRIARLQARPRSGSSLKMLMLGTHGGVRDEKKFTFFASSSGSSFLISMLYASRGVKARRQ